MNKPPQLTAEDLLSEPAIGLPLLTECSWSGGNKPCPSCPRRLSALHMCKLLQDEAANAQECEHCQQYACICEAQHLENQA